MKVTMKRERKRSPATTGTRPRSTPSKAPTETERIAQDALIQVARTKLLALGDFGHLHVRRHGEHIVIEQPGPPDAPDAREPVLRLTPIGGFRFGLSLCPSSGRWEMLPVSGVLANVLADAVRMLGPWLAPDPIMRGTSGMDY